MPDLALIYTGDGAFWPGVPARSLTTDEVEQYGGKEHLLKTGLYALPEEAPVAAAPDEPAPKRKKGA